MITERMNKIEKTGMICFWLALITELVIVMIDKSAYINPIEGQLFRVTFLLCCIKIAATKYSHPFVRRGRIRLLSCQWARRNRPDSGVRGGM